MSQTPHPGNPYQRPQPERRRRMDRLHADEQPAPVQPAAPVPRPASQPVRKAAPAENPYPHLRSYQAQQHAHHERQPLHQERPHAHHEHHSFHHAAEPQAHLPQQGYVPQAAQQPEAKAETAKSKKASVLSTRILLILCACVFAVSAFLLVRYFYNIAISRRASREMEAAYSAAMQNTEVPTYTPEPTATPAPTAAPIATEAVKAALQPTSTPNRSAMSASELWPSKYPQNPMLRISTVFYEMQRKNKDIVGWLKIDGVLEEAVLQRDNEYYLTHNSLGQRSVTGALFLDENCDLKTVPTQMLVHGHNMKEGAMFGSLKKYKVKDASFYRAHPFIDFNTIYETGRYVIFAVSEVDIRWDRAAYLPFWQDVRFSSADAFMNYVNKARSLSHYRCNVDVQPGDRILTLSTCEGADDNKRLIVMARKLREGENELQLNMSIMSTSDR